jgi:hypothetical protein
VLLPTLAERKKDFNSRLRKCLNIDLVGFIILINVGKLICNYVKNRKVLPLKKADSFLFDSAIRFLAIFCYRCIIGIA